MPGLPPSQADLLSCRESRGLPLSFLAKRDIASPVQSFFVSRSTHPKAGLPLQRDLFGRQPWRHQFSEQSLPAQAAGTVFALPPTQSETPDSAGSYPAHQKSRSRVLSCSRYSARPVCNKRSAARNPRPAPQALGKVDAEGLSPQIADTSSPTLHSSHRY